MPGLLPLMMEKTAFFTESAEVEAVLLGHGRDADPMFEVPLYRVDVDGSGDLLGLRLVQMAGILRNFVMSANNNAELAAHPPVLQFLMRGLAAANAHERLAGAPRSSLWHSIFRHRVALHATCLEAMHFLVADIHAAHLPHSQWLFQHCVAGLASPFVEEKR